MMTLLLGQDKNVTGQDETLERPGPQCAVIYSESGTAQKNRDVTGVCDNL